MIIPGATSYAVSFLDGMGMHTPVPGAALVVVWEDITTQPTRTVTILDGIKQVGESGAETESMSFGVLPPGNTGVWIFTTDDDASTGETVVYNSATIGGPLVGNLGLNASVLQMSGTSNSTSNTLSISTMTDHFSWVMGSTAADVPPVATEESTWGGGQGVVSLIGNARVRGLKAATSGATHGYFTRVICFVSLKAPATIL